MLQSSVQATGSRDEHQKSCRLGLDLLSSNSTSLSDMVLRSSEMTMSIAQKIHSWSRTHDLLPPSSTISMVNASMCLFAMTKGSCKSCSNPELDYATITISECTVHLGTSALGITPST